MRALCLHGHFYQPPREHPWLGVVEPERSAAPHRDWNARITAECYAPHAAARVLDGAGRLRAVVNTYEWTSFNFGPTLLAWLARHATAVVEALGRADAASRARTGHGNAWAQAYGHPILPLSTPRDVRTQVLWGRRDFEHRFGRPPEGMWLPEMAVDRTALATLAETGITLTMLAPHQALRVRPLGAGPEAWQPVSAESLDTRRLYRCVLGPGAAVDVVFRDEALSREIAFGALLADGAALARRLRDAAGEAPSPGIVTVAVDGETYGHHHRFGEMALAFALRALRSEPEITLAGPAAFRERHPPADEVEIAERTSWSCVHGVERWRADCGCGVTAEGSRAWRVPLRTAIDWLRDRLAVVYETRGGDVFRDPWGARDRWIDCVLEPSRTATWLAAEAARPLSAAGGVEARRLLELGRNALLMQTSCGWFFDDVAGIEPVQVLRYAARAIELAETLGSRLEEGFVARLETAGANVYRVSARGSAATPARVAATGAMLSLAGQPPETPGYDLRFSAEPADGRLVAEARVREHATGADAVVPVEAARGEEGSPTCTAGGETFTLGDLFGVQRERLLAALARDAGAAALDAHARLRPLLAPLVTEDASLPPELAVLLGWEAALAVEAGLDRRGAALDRLVEEAAAARRRGAIFPARWLAPRIARALEERVRELPASAPDALRLLDLARATDVRADISGAQIVALAWWRAHVPAPRPGEPLAVLRDRLAIVPEEAP